MPKPCYYSLDYCLDEYKTVESARYWAIVTMKRYNYKEVTIYVSNYRDWSVREPCEKIIVEDGKYYTKPINGKARRRLQLSSED